MKEQIKELTNNLIDLLNQEKDEDVIDQVIIAISNNMKIM